MLDQDEWRCPTCLDLLFKPAVNTCGHVYCFWCFHRAMSPYTPSACPVCRAKYGHLPAICAKLHRFLAEQFPEQYAARREETEAEERESGAQSPEPEPGPVPPPAAPGAWRPEHFSCDNPRCGKLLCRPSVLNCGHCVCQATCLGGDAACGQQGSQQPGLAVGAVAVGPAASQSPGSASGGNQSSSSAALYECPACGMAARQLPVVCKQLADLVAELFPAESRQREQESAAQLAAAAAVSSSSSSGEGPVAEQATLAAAAEQPAAMDSEEPSTPRASAARSEDGPALQPAAPEEQALQHDAQQAGGQAEGAQQHQNAQQAQQAQQQQALSPSLESALRRRQAEGGPASALAQRLEENLRQLASGEGYVHHGVGCDACGLYPISGRRYRCLDCPEAMGFDLCGDCMDRGVSDIVGRFNQRHTPQHRMQLVRPRITAMHMLQAANPELPMQQLLSLLELMWQDDDEGEQQAEQGQLAEQGQQTEQGQQRQQPSRSANTSNSLAAGGGTGPTAPTGQQGGSHSSGGSSSGSGVDFPLLRRGPRPAFDGHAVEPSPSSFANWHPPAEWADAQQAHIHTVQHPPPRQQQEQQQHAALNAEAQGLIEEAEDEEGPAAVHVSLERVLPHQPPQ